MKPTAFIGFAVGPLGLLLWCCTAGEALTPSPLTTARDAEVVETDTTLEAAVDSADAKPFVLPPPAPYDSPTCHHPPLRTACEGRWCVLPKGCFLMGAPETERRRSKLGEEQREVSFTHDLRISKYETTQAEWKALGLPNRSRTDRPELISDCLEDRCPIGNVSWFDTWIYANLLNDQEGHEHCAEPRECTGTPGAGLHCTRIEQLVPDLYACDGYRLPTRAEYEYAARGGTLTEFCSGPMTGDGEGPEYHLREVAWFTENSGHRTHPVGQKLPNHWGLFDILGNAGEWTTQEGYGLPNPEGPLVDWRGVLHPTDDSALIRGGFANAPPWGVRAGARSLAGIRYGASPGIGFRLVRSLPNSGDAGAPDAAVDAKLGFDGASDH
jgi:formylglycine-generating enzyme